MKKNIALMIFTLLAISVFALDGEDESNQTPFSTHMGPRFGVSYTFAGNDEDGYNYYDYDSFDYRLKERLLTVFGVNFQQRFKLGNTEHRFAFQEAFSWEGLETEYAVPCLMLLMGFQTASGIEAGAGPAFTAEGRRIAFTFGYEFRTNGINIPLDLLLLLPKDEAGITLTLTVGFNFNMRQFFFKPHTLFGGD